MIIKDNQGTEKGYKIRKKGKDNWEETDERMFEEEGGRVRSRK